MTKPHFQISRRRFLKAVSAAGSIGWFIDQELDRAAPEPKRAGANSRPAVLLIGCGGRGRADAGDASRYGDIVAVCDVDARRAESAAKQFSAGGKKPAIFHDFREALERPEIQAVVNGTPDHWHTLINLAAAKAKKDVYAEKPLTLTIDEGKHLVKAVRESGVILQTGSQQRSDLRFRLACELVRNGRIGRLQRVKVFLPAGLRQGPFRPSPVPAGLDWERWLGQAPKVDYVRERCHLTFRYWYDYSGGTMTDWGAHHNDIALWAIGLKGPVSVHGKPLAAPIPGGYTAFSEYEAQFTYANGVQHEVHTTTADTIYGAPVRRDGQHHGIRFEGPDGWIWVTRGDLQASDDGLLSAPLPAGAVRLYSSGNHMRNFFECAQSRRAPAADVEAGHRAASVCHLGNIAMRIGLALKWDPDEEQFAGENAEEANRWLERPMRPPYNYHFI